MIIGFAAGGTTDAIARYYAQKMGEALGTSIVVDNKPGAGQMLAIRSTVSAAPDGYTIYMGTASALSQSPGVRKSTPYDPLKDFSIIGLVASAPGVLVVSPELPVRNLRELANLASAKGGGLNYGSSGVGASSHLQTEYLLRLTGIRMEHIPYKSDSDIMREITAGSIQMGIAPVQGAMGSITSGKVRALAVTGTHRMAALPDVPSLTESDFKGLDGVDPYSYYGLLGPAGLPADVVEKLNDAINQVSRKPEVAAYVQQRLYAEPGFGRPQAFRDYIQRDLAKWRGFARHINLPEQ
ncbi:tripartite tricarboxylate transporter substrate binding protein [Variovorax guangxiensis]|uniref:Bug family tripartite tricarboxylate transporter substrate binding protein n=1 Tax=Variovorax guangxiensis TaxID=1775474 RepID=UPI002856C184|nr:tripartite tricarboxylate transporter substrate binding protein [Variovorax guangxiensis]MDR6860918.1 tripartite-type tricarboxylate transporter receptor subunit TctC [Variovorax guangxiensis]